MAAGHSLGEYTALVAAGALSVTDGVRLVRERGRLMQYASELTEGSMAAILGLEEAALAEVCREAGTEISNINTADQIVISGERQAVERTMELATEKGARRTVPLVVAGAFHSRLMEPAQEGLTKIVGDLTFHEPSVPIVANCTGQLITTAAEIKAELLSGLLSCVRWKDSVDTMLISGVSDFYEIGPGRVPYGYGQAHQRRSNGQQHKRPGVDTASNRLVSKSFNSETALERSPVDMEGESYAASRRRARTVAMQVLYEVDSVGHPWEVVSNRRLKDEELPTEIASFARGLVEGALRNSAEIDGIISRLAPSWPMHQLPVVDRSLLRLAVFEMIVERLSPPKVVINETVELAKLFGGDNSPKFINGVLGSVLKESNL